MLEFFFRGHCKGRYQHAGGPIEFGRGPQRGMTTRQILDDPSIELDHLLVESIGPQQVRLENLSSSSPIRFLTGELLPPGGSRESDIPISLTIGDTRIEIEPPGEENDGGAPRQGLSTLAFSVWGASDSGVPKKLRELGHSPSPTTLAGWFEQIILVQGASNDTSELARRAAQALVHLIDLDLGMTLALDGQAWRVTATARSSSDVPEQFSLTVLEHMRTNRRTYYQIAAIPSLSKSLQGVEAVIASPIFNDQHEVIGAIYGTRVSGSRSRASGIAPLEAQATQLLASAVGVGLARAEAENKATRRRITLEQLFTRELAARIDLQPNWLDRAEIRHATLLFGDIRGFSSLSETLGSESICKLVGEVMDLVTEIVHETGGVIVDYQGDGVLAMWNAPEDQHDHASRACRTAVEVLARLPHLSERWINRTTVPVSMGFGINSGQVIVGNTGSRHKLKYGPMGPPVNLASRVEGATKFFGVPILLTESTLNELGGQFSTRRIGRVRVVGIGQSVEIHELCPGVPDDAWIKQRDQYERGLAEFENRRWTAACKILHGLLDAQQDRYDFASLQLVTRALQCLKSPPIDVFDPTLDLPSK